MEDSTRKQRDMEMALLRALLKNKVRTLSSCENVLENFRRLVMEWITSLPHDSQSEPFAKVEPCGSYKLGAQLLTSDMDVVIIAPKYVKKEEFFHSFLELLKQNPNVSDISTVKNARVPLIKVNYMRVQMDVLFAQLESKFISNNMDFTADNLIFGADEQTINSLSGCRVAAYLLKSVNGREAVFQNALRAVKLWAIRNGIYSNALGYFGGVTWAIMVAQICQLYPQSTTTEIILQFFKHFANWDWNVPVTLVVLTDQNMPLSIETLKSAGKQSWLNRTDATHMMSVLTPTYPQMDTTSTVSKFTKMMIINQLNEGLKVCQKTVENRWCWDNLFNEMNYFGRYHYYVCLLLTAETEDDARGFCGFFQSMIRYFVKNLGENVHLSLANVNPKKFLPSPNAPFSSTLRFPARTMWFIGFKNADPSKKQDDFGSEFQKFVDVLAEQSQVKELDTAHVGVHSQNIHLLDLNRFISVSDCGKPRRRPVRNGIEQGPPNPRLHKYTRTTASSAPVLAEAFKKTSTNMANGEKTNRTESLLAQVLAQLSQNSSNQ